MSQKDQVIRVPPFYYLHVVDQNTHVTRLEVGPKVFVRSDHENVVLGPKKMIIIPPQHYCIISNPVVRDAVGVVMYDPSGQVKLNHGDVAIRLHESEPFPLYPGETISQEVTRLQVVPADTALLLTTEVNFVDNNGVKRKAGDEWLFEGPGAYIPRKDVRVLRTVKATIIGPHQALRLHARRECLDRDGKKRVEGEEWIVKRVGSYLPGPYEEVVDTVTGYVLTDKTALRMVAVRTFTDDFGQLRRSGEEWLITRSMTECHIPHVYEQVQEVLSIITLSNRQYCIIHDPVDECGRPQLGSKKLVQGECSFFLQPGEHLLDSIQDIYILGDNEALILRVEQTYEENDLHGSIRQPGDRFMIYGPCEYVPNTCVVVLGRRLAIPLHENEGIYVRDMKSGKVRAETGCTYMLSQDEEFWSKDLPPLVERILSQEILNPDDKPLPTEISGSEKQKLGARDKTRAVGFRVPHNAAVQVYDYKTKQSRVVFGPHQVILAPDEQFTQLTLSGGTPKRPGVVPTLCLYMGPRFSTDVVIVETADHARLSLQLSFNWHFQIINKPIEERSPAEAAKLFSVPDFIGDAGKALASRIRGSVAAVQFDNFHKNSARLIEAAVFGMDENRKIRDTLVFPQNGLVITAIDIQSVEPVDQKTRDALQKSVQLAIEITTSSQEAAARHEAERLEQEARGSLERQKIKDQADAEKARCELLQLQAISEAVASTGQAKAVAQSHAEAAKIEGEASVNRAHLKAAAATIEADSELARLQAQRHGELEFQRKVNEMEVSYQQKSVEIEIGRYEAMIKAIGVDTLIEVANAGPKMQVQLLQALNLRSTLITSGNEPINLFNTAKGLLGSVDTKISE